MATIQSLFESIFQEARELYGSDESCKFIIGSHIPALSEHIENIKKTYKSKELCKLAKKYAIDADKLWSDNKHSQAGEFALVALTLYKQVLLNKYPFYRNELAYVALTDNIIKKFVLWLNTDI
jgi:hypothetical protein